MDFAYTPQGIPEALFLLNRADDFLVYYDPDPDGVISGTFCSNLLKYYNRSYTYYINDNRAHGFKMPLEELSKYKGKTILAVDFAMSYEELKLVVDMGIDIISIDHHKISYANLCVYTNTETGKAGVIINNQYAFEPSEMRFLSGAGMVYYVFCNLFPWFDTKANRALVGISLLTDVRELENDNAAHFLSDTYTWDDDYSQYLLKMTKEQTQYSFGVQKYLDRNFIDYTFSPKINALFRLNKGYSVIDLFHKKPVTVSITECRDTQKEITAKLMANTQLTEYPNLTVGIINLDTIHILGDYVLTNFVGLVCGKIKNKKAHTTLILATKNNMVVRGSVRGLYDSIDYLKMATEAGFICGGHENAFGITGILKEIDWNALEQQVGKAEERAAQNNESKAKYLYVTNLQMQARMDKEVAKYNVFVRESHRMFYKCFDCDVVIKYKSEEKDFVQYLIDGVPVKSFDKSLDPRENGYVMPILNNGYVEYTLSAKV